MDVYNKLMWSLIGVLVWCVVGLILNKLNKKSTDEMSLDEKEFNRNIEVEQFFYRANNFKVCLMYDIAHKWGVFNIHSFSEEVIPTDKYPELDEKINNFNALVYMLRMKIFESCQGNVNKEDTVIILVDMKAFLNNNTRGMEILYGDMDDDKIEDAFNRLKNGERFSFMYRHNNYIRSSESVGK